MERLFVRRIAPALHYQKDMVFAVFPTATDALRGVAALEAMGIARTTLDILSGEPGHDARPTSVLRFFTDGYEELRGYAAHLEAGRALLTVRAADRDAADRVAAVIAGAGGTNITYFGPWVIESIAGETAPDQAEPGGITGTIAAGASTTIGTYLLPEVLGAFHARYPGVAVSLQIADSAAIAAALACGDLDLGVLEGLVPAALIPELVLIDRLVAIVPPSHHLAAAATVPAADLAREPFLLREPGSGTRDAVLHTLARHGVTPKVAMEIGSTEAIKRAVRAGLGVSIISALAIEDEVTAHQLHALTLTEGMMQRDLTVVRRPGDETTRVERLFLDMVHAQLTPRRRP